MLSMTKPLFAAEPTPIDLSKYPNPAPKITDWSISGIISRGGFNLINLIFFLIGLLFMVSLLSAALSFILNQGDPAKISQATNRITNSIIGLAVLFTSFIIVRLVASLYGFDAAGLIPF